MFNHTCKAILAFTAHESHATYNNTLFGFELDRLGQPGVSVFLYFLFLTNAFLYLTFFQTSYFGVLG